MPIPDSSAKQRPGDDIAEMLTEFQRVYLAANERYEQLPPGAKARILAYSADDLLDGVWSESVLNTLTRLHPKVRHDIVLVLGDAIDTVHTAQVQCDDRIGQLREEITFLRAELALHQAHCRQSEGGEPGARAA